MAMIELSRCRELADGTPDIASTEFSNALGTAATMLARSKDIERREMWQGILSALQAHGEPASRRKLSKAELSMIRREASSKALVARSKAALARRLFKNRAGIVSLNERKPAVFDAALEMIEDREAICLYADVETDYPGPIPEGGRKPYRCVTIAALDARIPGYMQERPCPWKSARKQEQERI